MRRARRQTRRRAGGKNDANDAEAAARAVQAGTVMGQAIARPVLCPGAHPAGASMPCGDRRDRLPGHLGVKDRGQVRGHLPVCRPFVDSDGALRVERLEVSAPSKEAARVVAAALLKCRLWGRMCALRLTEESK